MGCRNPLNAGPPLKGHTDSVTSAAFSPDANLLASASAGPNLPVPTERHS
ncbi:MAG: WD40 repeat domain-containing protein [Nitrospiraceae bacterium]